MEACKSCPIAGWRLKLEQYLLNGTVWCIHSQGTDALATPRNPEQWAEANSIIKRSSYSLEIEIAGPKKKNIAVRFPGSPEPGQSTAWAEDKYRAGVGPEGDSLSG